MTPCEDKGKLHKSLLIEISSGSKDALATLYDIYSPIMMGLAVRMLGDRRDAEDLLHDVFIEVWRNAHSYDPERASVRTWLLIRLRSRALDRLRSPKKKKVVSLEEKHQHARLSADDPSQLNDHRRVRRALQKLPPKQREVLELSYFQGLSSSEIATIANIPIGTVKSRVASGLSKLRSALREEKR